MNNNDVLYLMNDKHVNKLEIYLSYSKSMHANAYLLCPTYLCRFTTYQERTTNKISVYRNNVNYIYDNYYSKHQHDLLECMLGIGS